MRIAQLCPYSLTIPGGVQGQVMGLARALRTLGHDVRILAPSDGPPPEPGATTLGKSVPLAANGSVAPIAPDPACALRTIRALRDEEFDVLHLQEPLVPGPTLTALVTKPAPLVGTFHRAGASPLYSLFSPAVRLLARRLDVRCAVSADAHATASDALGGEYEMLFNGIEVERYAKADPHPTDRPTVLFVGRHEERKGLAVLVEALAHLPQDVRVWVAGEGPDTDELRRRTANDDRVEWIGVPTDEEKASLLRGADVFCAPSLHGESFGVVLLEAMAAGTPIVASDLPGYRNVAPSQARLVPPGDAPALAGAITDVLGDSRLAETLVDAGRARAEEFSMTRLAERYLELYSRVLKPAFPQTVTSRGRK